MKYCQGGFLPELVLFFPYPSTNSNSCHLGILCFTILITSGMYNIKNGSYYNNIFGSLKSRMGWTHPPFFGIRK